MKSIPQSSFAWLGGFSGFSHLSRLLLSCFLIAASQFTHAGLKEDLETGSYVLMMRHADAPGYSDPDGYNLRDCSTQRNLGETGKTQAKMLGQWLSSQGITSAQVYSSPWCRCKDTAALLNKGAVTVEPGLGSFFENRGNRQEQTRLTQNKIAQLLKTSPRKPVIMVTHQVNIQAFAGQSLSSGGMVLVKVNQSGQHVSHQLINHPHP
jgi:phosphohistidine phosphatase SixA